MPVHAGFDELAAHFAASKFTGAGRSVACNDVQDMAAQLGISLKPHSVIHLVDRTF